MSERDEFLTRAARYLMARAIDTLSPASRERSISLIARPLARQPTT
jgi:hypothetical protein